MHESSYREMSRFAATLPASRLLIADVGSLDVNGSYRPLFQRREWTYVGLDLAPGPNVDLVLCGENEWVNVPDAEYDVVISGQALEHARYPWLFVKEIARITKPGGSICIIAPYQWEYHPYPVDCWRVFPDGMRAVMEYNGLTVLSTYMTDNGSRECKGDTVGIARKNWPG